MWMRLGIDEERRRGYNRYICISSYARNVRARQAVDQAILFVGCQKAQTATLYQVKSDATRHQTRTHGCAQTTKLKYLSIILLLPLGFLFVSSFLKKTF